MKIEVIPNELLPVPGILTPDALYFIAQLQDKFGSDRETLLLTRDDRQQQINAGQFPCLSSETKNVRDGDWRIAPTPPKFQDRRVEITAPASSRKMMINALNSGANVYMADAEDSESPTLVNLLNGQKNLYDAVRRTISLSVEEKKYKLDEKTAVLMFRPRGLHLLDKHVLVDGQPISASIFDLGLYFYHNAKEMIERGDTPAIYWPKTEDAREVRWLNNLLREIEDALDIPQNTVKVCVLIETILAAFQMHEILYELKERSLGLNCGRWDYIFSFIKKLRKHPQFVLPDRSQVTMDKAFLKAYVDLLVKTCHRRGAHAMGGMAAQIPIKNDPEADAKAMAKVRADKAREVQAGHDGTWVAHPGLVPIAKEIFDLGMPGPNQLSVLREDVSIEEADLLQVPAGTITEEGLRSNISVGIQYIKHWCCGTGCVPINGLMEDAATAEICRAQVWQWIEHKCHLTNGRLVESGLVWKIIEEESQKLSGGEILRQARSMFYALVAPSLFWDFMTIPAAYGWILQFEEEADEL